MLLRKVKGIENEADMGTKDLDGPTCLGPGQWFVARLVLPKVAQHFSPQTETCFFVSRQPHDAQNVDFSGNPIEM